MGATGQLDPKIVLEGRYVIVRIIGQGGMGAVYLALDLRLDSMPVAIKEMSTKAVGGDLQSAIEAFKKEASMLISLKHPALPVIRDFFSQGEERWYLVMEYIEGSTLADVARARGPIPQNEVLDWGIQLCEIFDYLHRQTPPVIFRDLKPANIMLTSDGLIKLIDFGIARHFKSESAQDTTSFGSAGYAPPEQYGKNQTDSASDVYALGATMHCLLTGVDPSVNPFTFAAPGSIVEVSSQLEEAVMKALEFQPEKRPGSAREMLKIMTGAINSSDYRAGQGVDTKRQNEAVGPVPELSTVRIWKDINQPELTASRETELNTRQIRIERSELSTQAATALKIPQEKGSSWKQLVTALLGIVLLISFGVLIFYRGDSSHQGLLNSNQAGVTSPKNEVEDDGNLQQDSQSGDLDAQPGSSQLDKPQIRSSAASSPDMASQSSNTATLIVDPNGARWEWIAGDPNVRTGKAKITWSNGDCYQGEVEKGIIAGNGEYTTVSQQHYVGQFANNMINGIGTLTSKEGVWTGTFNDGVLDNGHFEANDKSMVYDGQFEDFSFHGQGTLVFLPDGAKYEGEFKNGVKNGWGTYTYPDGTKASGEWRNDKLVSE